MRARSSATAPFQKHALSRDVADPEPVIGDVAEAKRVPDAQKNSPGIVRNIPGWGSELVVLGKPHKPQILPANTCRITDDDSRSVPGLSE